jgi:hypothetical protein
MYMWLSFGARRSVSACPGYSSTVKIETIRPSEKSADVTGLHGVTCKKIVLIFTVTLTSKPAIYTHTHTVPLRNYKGDPPPPEATPVRSHATTCRISGGQSGRQVFSGYFGFPCQFSFHQLHHIHQSSYNALFSLDTDSVVKQRLTWWTKD